MTPVPIELFTCEGCGHMCQRELDDGLIIVGCPECGRQHFTALARAMKLDTHPDGSGANDYLAFCGIIRGTH